MIEIKFHVEAKIQVVSLNVEFNHFILFQGPKNFIITLKNPSLGAKIGNRSAIVCNITKGKISALS